MIDATICTALICFTISGGWAMKAKAKCDLNNDFVEIYYTRLYSLLPTAMLVLQIIALIINWINTDFLSSLLYLGIMLGTGVINGYIIAPILVGIFGHEKLGAVLAIIACLASTVFVFVSLFA